MAHTGKAPHEQAMAGYEVACKYGVFEARAFALADDMYAAMFAEDASRQAALARKDALLRMAMEAMLNLRKGAVAVWALGGSHETEQAIASIEAELSQSPAPVAVQPSQWQDIATAPKDGVFLVFMPQERPDDQIQVAKWHPNVKVIGGCFAFDRKPVTHFHALPPPPLSASPEDQP